MKSYLVVVLATAALLANGATWAQDLKGPAPAGKDAVQAGRRVDAKAQMQQMDAQIKKMQAAHDKMMRATTPVERQKLMEEQHKAIQEGMGLISQILGGMSGGAVLEQKAGTPDSNGPMQTMQMAIDMMALMNKLMMDQLGLIAPPSGRASAPTK